MGKAANYPKGVRIILDNGGISADRYTAVYGPDFDYRDNRGVTWYFYRAMNRDPMHPQGIGLSGQTDHPFWKRGARYRKACKRVAWDDLPEGVRRCVTLDLQDYSPTALKNSAGGLPTKDVSGNGSRCKPKGSHDAACYPSFFVHWQGSHSQP